jgi:predicted DNA binding CopG/RHH family protein
MTIETPRLTPEARREQALDERRILRMKNRRIGIRVSEDEERKIKAKVPEGMTVTRYMIEAATKRTVRL